MYGIVNKAMEDMVTNLKGPASWTAVKRLACVDLDSFVDMQPYDDEVTDRLVGATARLFSLEVDEVLEAFGEYWVLYTAEKGFGDILGAAGADLFEVLRNVDSMHGRLSLSFPDMLVPTMSVERHDAHSATLHYQSERAGFAPMLVGIVKGLGARFGTPVTIDPMPRADDAAPGHRFAIRLAH